jgi:hypothetical protein
VNLLVSVVLAVAVLWAMEIDSSKPRSKSLREIFQKNVTPPPVVPSKRAACSSYSKCKPCNTTRTGGSNSKLLSCLVDVNLGIKLVSIHLRPSHSPTSLLYNAVLSLYIATDTHEPRTTTRLLNITNDLRTGYSNIFACLDVNHPH